MVPQVRQHGAGVEVQRLLLTQIQAFVLLPLVLVHPGPGELGGVEGLLRHRDPQAVPLLHQLRPVQQRLQPVHVPGLLDLIMLDVIGPFQAAAVLHHVVQHDPGAIVVDVRLVLGLVIHQVPVDLRDFPDILRLPDRPVPLGIAVHDLHLLRVRHPALEAGEVELRRQGQQAQDRADRRQALPPSGKDPHGPADQHLRDVPAQARAQKQQGQDQKGRLPSVEAAPQQQRIDRRGKDQRAADRHTVAEDGLQHGEGHRVPGALHIALPVELQRQSRQQQAQPGVEQQPAQARDLPEPAVLQPLHIDPAIKPDHRRQPGEPLVALGADAVDQGPQHRPQAVLRRPGGQIQGQIGHRQDQQAPGEHGAEHRDPIEAEIGADRHQQPGQQILQRQALTQIQGPGEQGRQQLRGQHGQKAREPGGEKQGLPPQGQAVHQAAAAGIVQIAEDHHGRHDPHEKGDQYHVLAAAQGQALQALGQRLLSPEGSLGQLHRQQEEQQHEPAHPKGPAAAQQIAADAGVKAGYS